MISTTLVPYLIPTDFTMARGRQKLSNVVKETTYDCLIVSSGSQGSIKFKCISILYFTVQKCKGNNLKVTVWQFEVHVPEV